MFPYQGKTALITGASSGIGEVFARELAARGCSLVLVARSSEKLQSLAEQLSSQYNIQAIPLTADLRDPQAPGQIAAQVAELGLAVELLINNAGVISHGPFERLDAQREQDEIQVNIGALVGLTHAFLPEMLLRRSGAVVNVASIAAFQPVPYLSVYAATKAFVLSFSVALREEVRNRNVQVLALCPGTTSTNLFEAGNAQVAALGAMRTSEQVVATALRALEKKKSLVVDGLKNSLLSHAPRLIPRWFAARCAGETVKPKL